MRTLVYLVALVAAAPALAAGPGEKPPAAGTAEVLASLREIETVALKGECLKVREHLQEQSSRSPRDWLLRIKAAWCAMPSDAAWNELKDVSVRAQDLPWPNLGMAKVYLAWKMRDQAEDELKMALKKSPGFYPAWIAQADAARAAGHHDAAVALYRKVLQVADDPAARAGLGLSLLAQDKTAEAQAELNRGVDAWPSQPEALAALATLATTNKDGPAAIKRYRQLVELTPKDRRTRRTLADLEFDAGEKEAAGTNYLRLVDEGDTDPEVLRRLSTMVEQVRNAPNAERVFFKLSDLEASSPEPYYRLAELAEAQGDLERAEKRLQSAVGRAPGDPVPLLRLARLRGRLELYAGAVESYREAQALKPLPAEAAEEMASVIAKLKLPATPVKGSLDRIYSQVSTSLNALYAERVRESPDLEGALRLRVTVGEDGRAEAVETVEDTVGDPLLVGHAALALKDAQYPKRRREPLFEFELRQAVRKEPR